MPSTYNCKGNNGFVKDMRTSKAPERGKGAKEGQEASLTKIVN